MVNSRMVNPQNTKAWAIPGMVRLKSFLWAADLGELCIDAQVPEAVRVRTPGCRKAVEREEAPAGDGERHDRDGYSYCIANWQGGSSWEIGFAAEPAAAVCTPNRWRNAGSSPASAAEVLEVAALGRPSLSLVLGAQPCRTVGPVGWSGHLRGS